MAFNAVPREFDQDKVTRYLADKDEKYRIDFFSSLEYVFGKYIFPLIDPAPFEVLYSDLKRPCYPVNIILAHEIYQRMTEKSDAEMRHLMKFDPTVRVALHMYDYYDGTHVMSLGTLEEFRIRIKSYMTSTGIDLLRELGMKMAKKEAELLHTDCSICRIDSGFVDSHIEKESRFKLLYRCVARFVVSLSRIGIQPDERFLHYTDHNDWNAVSYHDTETPLESKIQTVIEDAFYLLRIFADDIEASRLEDWFLLSRVFREQVWQEKDGSFRLKKDKSEGLNSQTLQSPADPDATFREKAGEAHEGYLGLCVESGRGLTGIIQYWRYAANTASDPCLLEEYLRSLPDQPQNTPFVTLVGDGLFSSMDAKQTAARKGIEIVTTDLAGKKPDPFLKEFVLDSSETILEMCPHEEKPADCSFKEKDNVILAHFSKEQCGNCPFRSQCKVKEQKKSNVLRLSVPAYRRSVNWSAQTQNQNYAELAKYRNGVECIFSQLRNYHRIDEMPVRTYMDTNYWFNAAMCGINAKRVCKYFSRLHKEEAQKVSKGLA